MKHEDSLTDLFAIAKGAMPHGEASDFGFETRLRTTLQESGDSVFDWIVLLSWRFSFACLPVAIVVFAFFAFQSQYSLPDGMGSFVSNWAGFLPIEI